MAASDVVTEVIPGNPVHNGWAMVYTDKLGNQQTLEPELTNNINSSGYYHDLLNNRFDDTTYYTGDTS